MQLTVEHPLGVMVRFTAPGTGGSIQEFGLELNDLAMQGAPMSIEATRIQYASFAPVASRVTKWLVPDQLHGVETTRAIAQAYAGIDALQLDRAAARAPTDVGRLRVGEIRVSRLDSPIDAPDVWSFDSSTAPAALVDALQAAASLINTAGAWSKGETSVRSGVPVWERERGYVRD